MSLTEDNKSNRFVTCSFCNEEFLPSKIGEHLMMCGNKTDECPNCKKYIRRAVFAYHYENDCANLDEIDDNVNGATNQPNASPPPQSNNPLSPSPEPSNLSASLQNDSSPAFPISQSNNPPTPQSNNPLPSQSNISQQSFATFQPNNPSPPQSNIPLPSQSNISATSFSTFQPNNPPSPESSNLLPSPQNYPSSFLSTIVKENDRNIRVMTASFPSHSDTQNTSSQQSKSDFSDSRRITMVCPYCYQECELDESDIHRQNCIHNPINQKKASISNINGMSNQSSDQSYYIDKRDNPDIIPCEICREPIEWRYFQEHSKICIEREEKRMQNQSRQITVENHNGLVRCRICNELRAPRDLQFHQNLCQASRKIIDDQVYRRIYRPPPPANSSARPN